jgi:DNA-binding beta-propeller fold protein YncE
LGALIPYGLAIDSTNTLYLANQLSLRKLSAAGNVGMLEGQEVASPQLGTVFPYRTGLALDSAGNIYSAFKGRIRKLAPDGSAIDFAGSSVTGTAIDGKGTAARFSLSLFQSITIDPSGNLYMPDYENSVIRKITPQGDVSTVTAAGPLPGKPVGIAIDSSGTLYTLIGNALVKIQLQ